MHRQWQPVHNFDLHWRFWEDQYVVYNAGSGHTHLLDPVAALIVQNAAERDWDTDELIQHIVGLLELEGTQEIRENIQQILWNLNTLGLLEAVPA